FLPCEVPKGELWGAFSGETCLLAVITPCATGGKDATKEIVSYNRMNAKIVTDIQTIISVVGCVKSRGRSTIVDRNEGL
ncbi:hypothetical protein DFH08DRAFT_670456, partial [Mycena albidolilacea]